MSIVTTVSPSLSPKTSFHGHDRTFVGQVRRSSSRFSTTSTRNSHASTSPADSSFRQTPTLPSRSPALPMKPVTTVDSGTQYTPPNFPPTDRRHFNNINGTFSQTNIDNPIDHTSTSEKREDSASSMAHGPPSGSSRHDTQPDSLKVCTPKSQGMAHIGASAATQPETASPSKRARGPRMARKVLPRDYMNCEPRDLGHVVTEMLMELVQINDARTLANNALTRFHSRAPPAISIRDYLNRIIVHATPSPPILLSVVFWIDRLCAVYPHFNISSLTVHRYLITATTVAAKGLSDSFWTNSTYSRVGGVSLKELAMLELELLERMDWKIIPPADVLVRYYENLVARSASYVMEGAEDEESDAEEQHTTAEETEKQDVEKGT